MSRYEVTTTLELPDRIEQNGEKTPGRLLRAGEQITDKELRDDGAQSPEQVQTLVEQGALRPL